MCHFEKKAREVLGRCDVLEKLLAFEKDFLGKKGDLTSFLKELKSLSAEDKKKIGPKLQSIRTELTQVLYLKKTAFESEALEKQLQSDWIDVTKAYNLQNGNIHPVALLQRRIETIFTSMGFEVADGPEVETEWNNFDALNIPSTHPARDMQDTFWIGSDASDSKHNVVLRTHTSNIQIRSMLRDGAPVRIIVPGRVYRNEAVDMTHDATFYQVEGLLVDKGISLAHLKGTIETMLQRLFEKKIKIRFRPGYFPFVEPGLEVDIWFEFIDKSGRKRSRWLEFMGAGMVHPNVLKNCDVDPDVYSGFAFGFGLTRLAMLRYGIDDIRLLFSHKKEFLTQF